MYNCHEHIPLACNYATVTWSIQIPKLQLPWTYSTGVQLRHSHMIHTNRQVICVSCCSMCEWERSWLSGHLDGGILNFNCFTTRFAIKHACLSWTVLFIYKFSHSQCMFSCYHKFLLHFWQLAGAASLSNQYVQAPLARFLQTHILCVLW